MLRCLEFEHMQWFLKELHDGTAKGNYASDNKTHKVMRFGFYWSTLFKDSHAYTCKFPVCYKCADREA